MVEITKFFVIYVLVLYCIICNCAQAQLVDKSLFALRGSQNTSLSRYQHNIKLKERHDNYRVPLDKRDQDLELELELEPKQKQEGEIEDEEDDYYESSSTLPLVVIAIPTFNRKEFLLQSLEYIRRQQYPRDRIAVAILDDSNIYDTLENDETYLNKVEQLKNVSTTVYYKHRTIDLFNVGQENIGSKRNSIVKWIKKELIKNEKDFIIIHWDDDDWHAPHRISKQTLPLITGQSDLTALDLRTILLLQDHLVYYRYAPDGKKYALPIMSINGGTLCYWASIYNENSNTVFPDLNCGEDIMFVDRVINKNSKITVLDDSDISVIYLRHPGNTWLGLDPSSWILLDYNYLPPRFKKDYNTFYKSMQFWQSKKFGKYQGDKEPWMCSSNIEEVNTFVVNEIRGLSPQN